MFNRKNDPNSQSLNEAITKLLSEMREMRGDSEEYSAAADNFVKLVKAQNDAIKLDNEYNLEEQKLRIEEEKIRSWRPSSDAVVGAVASIAGIVLILNFERMGVITTRAMGILGKMR